MLGYMCACIYLCANTFMRCMYVVGVGDNNVCVSCTYIVSKTNSILCCCCICRICAARSYCADCYCVCWFYINPLICATFISTLNLRNGSSGDKCWKKVIWIRVYSPFLFSRNF